MRSPASFLDPKSKTEMPRPIDAPTRTDLNEQIVACLATIESTVRATLRGPLRSEAEDVVHDTVLRLLMHGDGFLKARTPRSYAAHAARNAARDRLRYEEVRSVYLRGDRVHRLRNQTN